MPDPTSSPKPHHALFGQILGTVLLAAIDAGAIATNPAGVATDPVELAEIIGGFAKVWTPGTFPPAASAQLKLPQAAAAAVKSIL